MKTPLRIKCMTCSEPSTVWIDANDWSFQTTTQCGHFNVGSLGPSFTLGRKILYRSAYEYLETKDYPVSMIFAAAALECQISYLHHKWLGIGARGMGAYISDTELDEMLRTHNNVRDRLSYVASLMHADGLDAFVAQDEDASRLIEKEHAYLLSDQLAAGLQRHLFWPRNRILHLGHTQFHEADANRSYHLGSLGLWILEKMDSARRKREKNNT